MIKSEGIRKYKMENKDILLSLVVPIFGVERYIHRFLNSIRKNLQENMEVILVDDGSKDNCGKIIDEFSEKYNNKYFIKSLHKVNGGVSSARNVGLSKANGEYVLFVDPDDCLDKECINEILKIIRLYNDVDMIIFDYYEQQRNGEFYLRNIADWDYAFIKKEYLLEKLIEDDDIRSHLVNKVIRREIAKKVIFRESINYMEDYAFLTDVSLYVKKVVYLPKVLYYYFYNDNGLSKKRLDSDNKNKVFYLMKERFEKYSKFIDTKYQYKLYIYAINRIILKYRHNSSIDVKMFEKYLKDNVKRILLNHRLSLNYKKKFLILYFGIGKYYYGKVKNYKYLIVI